MLLMKWKWGLNVRAKKVSIETAGKRWESMIIQVWLGHQMLNFPFQVYPTKWFIDDLNCDELEIRQTYDREIWRYIAPCMSYSLMYL